MRLSTRLRGFWTIGIICTNLLLAACGDDGRDCVVGADCASGVCRTNGTCAPVDVPGAGDALGGGQGDEGGLPGLGGDAGQTEDAGSDTNGTPGPGPDGGGGGGGDSGGGGGICFPNADGRIERFELPVKVGLATRYLTAQNATVDTQGTMVGDVREWDFTGALTGDHLEILEARDIEGLWFQDAFPDATYAAKLTDTDDLLGVFRLTDTALEMLGIVSPSDVSLKTELKYNPPVKVLDFPIELGKSWSSDSKVSGWLNGLFSLYYYNESYTYSVDNAGRVRTPFADFDILRVRSRLAQKNAVGFELRSVRSQLFMAECFGTVASVRSKDNESKADFTTAAEVRRLTP